MTLTHRQISRVVVPVALVVGLLGLSACSGASTGSANPSATGPATASGSPGPSSGAATPLPTAPHQTESNPPGDIPDQQVFVAYTPPGAHFSVKVPEGWARVETVDGVTFTDKLNSISLRELSSATAPTEATVTATAIPQLRRAVPAFAFGKVTTVTRHAGRAIRITYLGTVRRTR